MSSLSSISGTSLYQTSVGGSSDSDMAGSTQAQDDAVEAVVPVAAIPGSSTAIANLFASLARQNVADEDAHVQKEPAPEIEEIKHEADAAHEDKKLLTEDMTAAAEFAETEKSRIEALRILKDRIGEDRIRDMDFLAQVARR